MLGRRGTQFQDVRMKKSKEMNFSPCLPEQSKYLLRSTSQKAVTPWEAGTQEAEGDWL